MNAQNTQHGPSDKNLKAGPKEPAEVLSEDEAEDRDRAAADAEKPKFSVEVAAGNVTDAMVRMRDQVEYWASRGRYNKVRIKRKGKAVLPDIPVGALLAFEAATFFWTGLLRAAVVNVVGRVFFEVELVNEAEEHYREGLSNFLASELEDAEKGLKRALQIDPRFARAHLQMGVLRKVQGRAHDARLHFEKAKEYDPKGIIGTEAQVHLKKLKDERRVH